MINGKISAYTVYMRRKAGSLIPIEILILEAGSAIKTRSDLGFHGFMIAKEIKERERARLLTAHGTLNKALGMMEKRACWKAFGKTRLSLRRKDGLAAARTI